MALLPVTLRRRLRSSGFSEEQTDALDEASEATAEAAREGLAKREDVRDEYHALRTEISELRSQISTLANRMDDQMRTLKWWLFGSLATLILGATAIIVTAIAVWG